jgi:hypothetical protein
MKVDIDMSTNAIDWVEPPTKSSEHGIDVKIGQLVIQKVVLRPDPENCSPGKQRQLEGV